MLPCGEHPAPHVGVGHQRVGRAEHVEIPHERPQDDRVDLAVPAAGRRGTRRASACGVGHVAVGIFAGEQGGGDPTGFCVLGDRGAVPGKDLASERFVVVEADGPDVVAVALYGVGEQVGTPVPGAAAAPVERVGAQRGVADRDHADGERFAVDHDVRANG